MTTRTRRATSPTLATASAARPAPVPSTGRWLPIPRAAGHMLRAEARRQADEAVAGCVDAWDECDDPETPQVVWSSWIAGHESHSFA